MNAMYLISFIMCSVASVASVPTYDICRICSCKYGTSVDCQSKELTKVPKVPKGTRELNLRNNKITSFSSEDFNDDLKFVLLRGNLITTLKADNFVTLRSLRYLGLGKNKISALPDGVFNGLEKMEVVRLEHNKLETFSEKNLKDLPDLEELYLGYNMISSLPASVQHCKRVKVLDVEGNPGVALGKIYSARYGKRRGAEED